MLKALFTFASVSCVLCGAALVILGGYNLLTDLIAGELPAALIFGRFLAATLVGAVTAVLGPMLLRLTYEGAMMFVLLVKNVMELNRKTPASGTSPAEEPETLPEE